MPNQIELALVKLVDTLSQHPSIRAVGMSGGERPYPEPGQADIDLFVYCSEIPPKHQRQELLAHLPENIKQIEIGRVESGHWGQGDCLVVAEVETWLLYFSVAEACAELEAILDGQYLGRLDSYYYPMGRCAMWKDMQVFYDPDGFLQSLKNCLAEYPQELAQTAIHHHLKALEDLEDLERAVGRKDVLFYHFALDLALDHFLQALFALNKQYFPSRKRSESYMQGFTIKPDECEKRLRQVLVLGGNTETVDKSYELWIDLVRDLEFLAKERR